MSHTTHEPFKTGADKNAPDLFGSAHTISQLHASKIVEMPYTFNTRNIIVIFFPPKLTKKRRRNEQMK